MRQKNFFPNPLKTFLGFIIITILYHQIIQTISQYQRLFFALYYEKKSNFGFSFYAKNGKKRSTYFTEIFRLAVRLGMYVTLVV